MSTTHFGFKTVDEKEKAQHVRGVFDSVASKYDVMNDLMSMGLHRVWKAYTVQVANLKEGDQVLDIAGGTGDLSMAFAKKVGATGRVVLAVTAWWTTAWPCPLWCATPRSCLFRTTISTWSAWPLACAT
jgi:hypothetical protein